jgi:hypothetical protein
MCPAATAVPKAHGDIGDSSTDQLLALAKADIVCKVPLAVHLLAIDERCIKVAITHSALYCLN